MTEPIRIRNVGSDQAAALRDLVRRAFGEYRGVLQPESSVFVETEAVVARKLAEGGGFVAERGRSPVGCVIAEAKDGRGYLGRLAVLPEARRQGLARRLMLAGRGSCGRAASHAPRSTCGSRSPAISRCSSNWDRETARHAHPGCAAPSYLVMAKAL